jgi:hypothetical protein
LLTYFRVIIILSIISNTILIAEELSITRAPIPDIAKNLLNQNSNMNRNLPDQNRELVSKEPTVWPSLDSIQKRDKPNTNQQSNYIDNNLNNLNNLNSNNEVNIEEDEVIILNKEEDISSTKNDIPTIAATIEDPSQIIDIRNNIDEVTRNLNKPLVKSTNRVRKVNYKEGVPISIVIKKGYSTIIQFEDSSSNQAKFEFISPGSPFFQVTQFSNKIEIKATDHYKQSNLTVGVRGFNIPVIFNITEDRMAESYTSFITVNMSNPLSFKGSSTDDIQNKSAILNEVFKFNELRNNPTVDYEVYGLVDRNYVTFNENLLKIHHINKLNKDYYLVLLDKNFSLYGASKKSLSSYNNQYNVYFLNFNDSVFTIRSNNQLQGSVEKYRIIIKG